MVYIFVCYDGNGFSFEMSEIVRMKAEARGMMLIVKLKKCV